MKFLQFIQAVALTASILLGSDPAVARPNVVLIITDDQGYGDLGVHGNPVIKTPNIDRLAGQGARLSQFLVSPVCSPTRSSLMTGRYNYRTGVVDTFRGRSMMHPDEVTLAERLRDAGYRTGLFGKWHLGDNYPLRAMDQGFEESLVHKGGGLTQPSDPPGNTYFNPLLSHNGIVVPSTGYCSDVFTDAAIDYIRSVSQEPFFVYLAFNAPHTPLQVKDEDAKPYLDMNLTAEMFPSEGHPLVGKFDPEATAKVYGMVTNIDDNLGRLFARLDEWKLADDTIVIFMTDNGPQQPRYVSGFRATKGTVYEGGIHVPCFIRWPGKIAEGKEIPKPLAHIDMTPTLLDLCGIEPGDAAFDGRSFAGLITGASTEWPDRTLFFQWHRGDAPQMFRAFAARGPRYKLVQAKGREETEELKLDFELFDLQADPYETKNIAKEKPMELKTLKREYERWFEDVNAAKRYEPPRIILGTTHENPVTLTRQDWRGALSSWGPQGLGHWEVAVASEAIYDVTLRFEVREKLGFLKFKLGSVEQEAPLGKGSLAYTFKDLKLPAGDARLEAWIEDGDKKLGMEYVDVKRVD